MSQAANQFGFSCASNPCGTKGVYIYGIAIKVIIVYSYNNTGQSADKCKWKLESELHKCGVHLTSTCTVNIPKAVNLIDGS